MSLSETGLRCIYFSVLKVKIGPRGVFLVFMASSKSVKYLLTRFAK
jgi:hypothetical protein